MEEYGKLRSRREGKLGETQRGLFVGSFLGVPLLSKTKGIGRAALT